jgi:hypothetical protein
MQGDCNVAARIFDDADEFRRVLTIADRRVTGVNSVLSEMTFDAPLIRNIKAAINSVRMAQADSNLSALKESLAKLNQVFDENTLRELKEARDNGFDSIEEFNDHQRTEASLRRSGIHLNPKRAE